MGKRPFLYFYYYRQNHGKTHIYGAPKQYPPTGYIWGGRVITENNHGSRRPSRIQGGPTTNKHSMYQRCSPLRHTVGTVADKAELR